MNITTYVIQRSGIGNSYLLKRDELESSLMREVSFNPRIDGSKAWASPKDAQQFQANQLTSMALNETMARLRLAR